MKRLFLGALAMIGLFSALPAHAISWTYYRSITVTSTTSIASGTNANFPMLVSSTLASWKSSSNGGNIQNLVTAPNGGQAAADLVFATSTANCTSGNYLNFETESYSSSTGALIDWVNVPSLSAGSVIYACYDASSVNTDQSHPSSTWNSNYVGVFHLATNGFLKDSTSFGATLTIHGSATTTTGTIDGAATFNGSTDYLTATLGTGVGTVNTVEGWLNSSANNAQDFMLQMQGGTEALTGKNDGTNFGNDCFFGSAYVCYNNPFTVGTWYQFANTRNAATTNGYTMFVNGAQVAQTTRSFADGTSTVVYIGANTSAGSLWQGKLDEIRISKSIFAPSWITTEYNNQSSPSTFYAVGSETAFAGASSPSRMAYILNWE